MAKSTPSIIASLLLLCLTGTALAQTTTIRGAGKGSSTPQPVTATPIDANHTGVDVNIVGGAGSGGDGALLDGVSAAIKATVFDFTNSNPLGVVLRDTNGDYVSVGGGTQYNQGTATTDTDVLSMVGCVRSDTAAIATGVIDQDRARCIVDSTGRAWVHVGAIDGGTLTSITNPVAVTGTFFQATQPVSGTFWQATQPISGTVTVTDGAGALNVIVDSLPTVTVTDGAGSLNVIVDSGSLTADTELPTAAAIAADDQAAPTAPGTYAYIMCFDGTLWDRCRGTLIDGDDNSIAFAQNTSLVIAADYVSDGTAWVRKRVYLEDEASTGSEQLSLTGTVRRDVPTISTSANGDFQNLKTDMVGRLWTRVGQVDGIVSVKDVKPVFPGPLNRLQYATMMRAYCLTTICSPLPGGLR